MTTPRIRSTVNPRIRSMVDAMRLDVGDMRRMLTQVDREFAKNERKLFASEGSSGGSAWPPLSPKYAKQKKRRFPGRKIMARTGRLRKGLSQRRHTDHVARFSLNADRASLMVGVRNIVAAYHGAGKSNLRNPRLPKRDVMQMTTRQRRRYRKIVRDYLVNVKLARLRRGLRQGRIEMESRRRLGGGR